MKLALDFAQTTGRRPYGRFDSNENLMKVTQRGRPAWCSPQELNLETDAAYGLSVGPPRANEGVLFHAVTNAIQAVRLD